MAPESARRRNRVPKLLLGMGTVIGALAMLLWVVDDSKPSKELLSTLAQVNVGLVIAVAIETRPGKGGRAEQSVTSGYGVLSITLLLGIALLAGYDHLPTGLEQILGATTIALTGFGTALLLDLQAKGR